MKLQTVAANDGPIFIGTDNATCGVPVVVGKFRLRSSGLLNEKHVLVSVTQQVGASFGESSHVEERMAGNGKVYHLAR